LKKKYFSSHNLPKQQSTSFWSQGILGVNNIMFVYAFYNIVFARAPTGTKVEGYLVHNHHKHPRLQTSDKLFNDVGKESISAIVAS
jgi:hypothetical protein